MTAGAQPTPATATVIMPLRTDSGLPSARALTAVPQYNPLTDATNWDWSAQLIYYSTNTVPGWGTNVAVLKLTPNIYTLTLAGAPGQATLTITTNNVGQTNWAATLAMGTLSLSAVGATPVYVTNFYTISTGGITNGQQNSISPGMLQTQAVTITNISSALSTWVAGTAVSQMQTIMGNSNNYNGAFAGNLAGGSNINPSALTGSGTVPLTALSGIRSNQFDAGTSNQLALAGSGGGIPGNVITNSSSNTNTMWIGYPQSAGYTASNNVIIIGYNCAVNGTNVCGVGYAEDDGNGIGYTTTFGNQAGTGDYGIAVGYGARGGNNSIVIGLNENVGSSTNNILIGSPTFSSLSYPKPNTIWIGNGWGGGNLSAYRSPAYFLTNVCCIAWSGASGSYGASANVITDTYIGGNIHTATNLSVSGALFLTNSINLLTNSATPANTSVIKAWATVTNLADGSTWFMPLYQ